MKIPFIAGLCVGKENHTTRSNSLVFAVTGAVFRAPLKVENCLLVTQGPHDFVMQKKKHGGASTQTKPGIYIFSTFVLFHPNPHAMPLVRMDRAHTYPGEPGKMTVWKPGLWGAAAARLAW